MGETREPQDRREDRARVADQPPDSSIRERGVLPVMRARKMRCGLQVADLRGGLIPRVVQFSVDDEDTAAKNLADRNGDSVRLPPGDKLGVDRRGVVVVDPDRDMSVMRRILEQ